jgi:alpha-glucosidase
MAGERRAAGALRGWRATAAGLRLELESATALVSMAEDGCVRLQAAPGAEPPPACDAALGRDAWRPVRAQPRELGDGGVCFAHEGPHGAARVEVPAGDFELRVLDRSGGLVAAFDGLGFDADGGGELSYRSPPEERLYGFGEKPGGLDKRGTRLVMRNRDAGLRMRDPLYVSIPFFLALRHDAAGGRACGVMLEAPGPSRFDVAADDAGRVRLETACDFIDLCVFPGPKPADVLRRFTARVGRTPLPPRWALGHHQSRWSYASAARLRALAAEIRARGIPTDALYLDIDYMDRFRVFTWHPRRFPDPKGLVAELAREGFRVVAIVDPGVAVDDAWPVYREGCERGVFCRAADGRLFSLRVWPGRAALPDFNREDVRRFWGEQHRPLLDAGVAGIWNDMNEPAGWGADLRAGRLVLPLRGQDLSGVTQAGLDASGTAVAHERVRNVYGYQECRATRAELEAANPGRRPFVLTRSGYTGIQRFAAVWTGDNRSRWRDLRECVPMLLNLSLSGVAFCGADIGGFVGACTPELYARWIQLGALQPFARTHCAWTKRGQEPWRFGARVERIAREALELRMRLLPYLEGLFREAEETGAPVWRPLFYEFPDDARAATVEDQLMLGPALLAAPVLERGARERELYLPSGRWLDWNDDTVYTGPRLVRVSAPLERLPLFARAGSIIPTRSPVRHAGETPAEPCVLEVVPGADGSALLVEDDGETTAYREGATARTALRLWGRAGGRLRLEIARREGLLALPQRCARVVIRACPPPAAVLLDGVRLAAGEGVPGHLHQGGRLHVRVADVGEGYALEVEPAP